MNCGKAKDANQSLKKSTYNSSLELHTLVWDKCLSVCMRAGVSEDLLRPVLNFFHSMTALGVTETEYSLLTATSLLCSGETSSPQPLRLHTATHKPSGVSCSKPVSGLSIPPPDRASLRAVACVESLQELILELLSRVCGAHGAAPVFGAHGAAPSRGPGPAGQQRFARLLGRLTELRTLRHNHLTLLRPQQPWHCQGGGAYLLRFGWFCMCYIVCTKDFLINNIGLFINDILSISFVFLPLSHGYSYHYEEYWSIKSFFCQTTAVTLHIFYYIRSTCTTYNSVSSKEHLFPHMRKYWFRQGIWQVSKICSLYKHRSILFF